MLESLPKRHARKRERRRGLTILLVLILLVGGPLAAGGGWWFWATSARGPREHLVLEIPVGASGSEVADLLKAKGVIRSTTAFRLLTKFRHLGNGFEAGTYTTPGHQHVSRGGPQGAPGRSAAEEDDQGRLPRGPHRRPDRRRAQDELGILRKDFIAAATSGTWKLSPYLPKNATTVEGFLFPETYEFDAGVDANAVIKRLLAQFQLVTKDLPWNDYKKLGLKSPYDVVIVASMIEREAKFQDDRGKIARVIYNRIKKGMPLQIDATVEYALRSYKPKLTFDDLKVDSPYNTYLHTGTAPDPHRQPGPGLHRGRPRSHRGALALLRRDRRPGAPRVRGQLPGVPPTEVPVHRLTLKGPCRRAELCQ